MSRSSSRSRNNLPSTSGRIRIANEISEREHDREGPVPSSLSLLSARRPSWAPAPHDNHNSQDRIIAGLASYRDVPTFNVPNQADNSSPEIDGGNFRRNLHIDMKDLVGDAVGNMSISPVGRDIVLAARRGLFIIDLEAPLEVPRFLPQGGTWEVADVQWNPHHLRAEYIVSTSSEKLLIWNLSMPGNMSIEHVLRSHYRAITDINWHTSEPHLVSSVGIDSWIWTWDLRETRKPVLGLCAFNAGGTQVKWNRQDADVLASSHMDEVLIWDRRKGSLPTARIRAHSAKIYGIDWAHARASDIVTCSLDKSIKVWNVKEAISTEETAQPQPLTAITTRYPVWRARDLPFGRGVLSLPQRGETILEMWAEHNPLTPAEVFAGHEDVVKEFVWRRGSTSGEYQLITWSKDRTLRFWHVGPDIMEKFGWKAGTTVAEAQPQNLFDQRQSFRHPPQSLEHVPTLSAPIGSRSILAEVRAGPPQPPPKPTNPVLQPHHGSAARGKGILLLEPGAAASSPRGHTVQPIYNQTHRPIPIPATAKITRGKAMGGRSAKVDPIVWLSSVKVENRRDESSSSRVSSSSTASPQRENSSAARNGKRKRSLSKVRENKDGDGEQSLWPEITSVLTKLASSNKIRLEKNDLSKRRTCTIGLHGPWGESSSVFVRVSFRFPKGYPHAPHPEGTPEVELERTPLISRRTRAIMRKKLRALRERHRPCLEACLRFLLFGDEDDQVSASVSSESSSEDEDPGQLAPKPRTFTAALLRNNKKSLTEPRTSQGVFGPNGELVCFFWSPRRGPRNSEAASSANNSLSPPSFRPLFQPPSLLSDAVRRLALAACDQQVDRADFRRSDESDYTVRIMTNLLTFSAQKSRRNSDGHPANDGPSHCTAPAKPACRTTVYIRLPDDVNLFRRKVASEYIFDAATLPSLCATNARIAREHGQFSHERVFRTLESLFPPREAAASFNIFTVTGLHIIEQLHKHFCVNYDIQMLAMIAVVFLKAYARVSVPIIRPPSPKEPPSAVSKTDDDYFSSPVVKDPRAAVLSPGWPRLSSVSPTGPSVPAASLLSTSTSSRGSWSSLFNPGSVRQLMSGVPESITTPLDAMSPRAPPVPIPIGDIIPRLPNPDSPRRKALGKDASPSLTAPLSKSWSETHVIPLARPSLSQSSSQGRRPTFPRVDNAKQTASQKKLVIFDKEPESKESASANVCRAFFQPDRLARLACHIISYAEVLLKWKLDFKRLELLNAVKTSEFVKTPPVSQQEFGFDIQPTCKRCGQKQTNAETCSLCGARPGKPSCSICRLPVKGLSIWCGHCLHISHVKCWRDTQSDVCGSGCGCPCSGSRKPSSRRDSRTHSPSPLVV